MSVFGAFGSGGSNVQGGFGDFGELLGGGSGFMAPPPGYNYNAASGMNEQYTPNSYAATGGITHRQAPEQSFDQGGMGQFQAAALQDYQNLVNANQMNYGNFTGAMGDYRDSVMGGAEDIRMGGQQAFDFLTGEADQLSAMGSDIAGGIRGVADQAVDEFKDLSAQQASSLSAGLAAKNRSTHQQLDAAAKTGDPQAIAAKRQQEMDSAAMNAQVMTQQLGNYNNSLAGLNMQRAGIYGQAGQVQLSFEQQGAALNQAGAAMQQAAISNAANFEAQGLSNYASCKSLLSRFFPPGCCFLLPVRYDYWGRIFPRSRRKPS